MRCVRSTSARILFFISPVARRRGCDATSKHKKEVMNVMSCYIHVMTNNTKKSKFPLSHLHRRQPGTEISIGGCEGCEGCEGILTPLTGRLYFSQLSSYRPHFGFGFCTCPYPCRAETMKKWEMDRRLNLSANSLIRTVADLSRITSESGRIFLCRGPQHQP